MYRLLALELRKKTSFLDLWQEIVRCYANQLLKGTFFKSRHFHLQITTLKRLNELEIHSNVGTSIVYYSSLSEWVFILLLHGNDRSQLI